MSRPVTIRAAWIGAIAMILAAIIVGIMGFFNPSNNSHGNPTDELVSLLKYRASKILGEMDKEIRRYLSSKTVFLFKNEIEKLNAARTLFVDLHKKHLEAINAGNFILAHGDIVKSCV